MFQKTNQSVSWVKYFWDKNTNQTEYNFFSKSSSVSFFKKSLAQRYEHQSLILEESFYPAAFCSFSVEFSPLCDTVPALCCALKQGGRIKRRGLKSIPDISRTEYFKLFVRQFDTFRFGKKIPPPLPFPRSSSWANHESVQGSRCLCLSHSSWHT